MPPFTEVKSLDFEDHPFEVESWNEVCGFCGSETSFLDEIVVDDTGRRLYVCSDTDYCRQRMDRGCKGSEAGALRPGRGPGPGIPEEGA